MREFRLQADKCCDFEDFTTLLKSLVELTMPGTTFTQIYPDGDDPGQVHPPIITFKVLSKVSEHPNPQVREQFEDSNDSNKIVTVMGQRFEYQVEFGIWGDTNEEANRIMSDFEDMMLTYKGDLMKAGVQKITFLAQGEDNISQWRARLASRTLIYMIKIEQLTVESSSKLRMIVVRNAKTGELMFTVQ